MSRLSWKAITVTSFLLLLFLSAAFAARRAIPWDVGCPSFSYRVLGDRSQLSTVLETQLSDGATIGRVKQLLGEPVHVKTQNWINLQRESQGEDWYASNFPDGIVNGDIFLAYPSGSTLQNLQFRNGRLLTGKETAASKNNIKVNNIKVSE